MSIILDKLKKLPDAPGVYLFKKGTVVLYVGKATSLKSRVRSYLSHTAVESRGPKILKLIDEATKVDYEETGTVLEALIREAALIKKYQPPYNAKEKSDKSFNFVVVTDEEYPRVFVMRERELHVRVESQKYKAKYGPFPNGTQLRDALKIIRKIFPYRGKSDAPLGQGRKDGRTEGRRISRLYEEIGLAPRDGGVGDPKAYARTVKQLILFFEGKKDTLLTEIEREMKRAARAREFEVASEMKRRLFALKHINDVALIKDERTRGRNFRIEAYDVAHTSGTDVVGVMTVTLGGEVAKNEYRMFKIKGDEETKRRGNNGGRFVNDTAALSEMLERRFGHPEWAYPRIVVVDGSTAQINAAKRVLTSLGIDIPIVAVTKNDRHKPERLVGDPALVAEHGNAIILSNAEAHRFAVSYHRKKREVF